MTDDKESRRVGYGKPPENTRFRPGVSGNPAGRPKKVPTLQTEVLEELGESTAEKDGKPISNARKIAKALVKAGIGGNMRATAALLAFCAKQQGDANLEEVSTVRDADILDDFMERELRRRAQESETGDHATADLGKGESKS